MPKFGDLVLEKGGLRDPGSQRQLDVTPCRTAIWDKAAVREEETQEASDIRRVQIFSPYKSTL